MTSPAPPAEATTLDQGEMPVQPLRFVVAPDHGRFHPATLSPAGDGAQHLVVTRGMLIGEVCNGTTSRPVRSPFNGLVDAWLVWAGQLVAPGQPLCSLRIGWQADATVGE